MRLFVAIELPPSLRAALARAVTPGPGVRPVPAANLHLTLRFLGDLDAACTGVVREALARVDCAAFELVCSGGGRFGAHGGRGVLWVGVAPRAPVNALAAAVERVVSDAGLAPARRRFHPHVTVARCARGTRCEVPDVARASGPQPAMRVDAFSLVRSFLYADGARYQRIARYPLRPRDAEHRAARVASGVSR